MPSFSFLYPISLASSVVPKAANLPNRRLLVSPRGPRKFGLEPPQGKSIEPSVNHYKSVPRLGPSCRKSRNTGADGPLYRVPSIHRQNVRAILTAPSSLVPSCISHIAHSISILPSLHFKTTIHDALGRVLLGGWWLWVLGKTYRRTAVGEGRAECVGV